MKKIIIIFTAVVVLHIETKAQQFIDKASIEYEVKTNVKKTIGGGSWAEMMKENMPQFKTGFYQFTFSGNKSIYKFDRWDDGPKVPEFLRRDDEQNIWYLDHTTGKFNMQKAVIGSNFIIDDSIPVINWRLTNESRLIAGFNCRKAVGKILDSIYVFAFYTDEILISGGPCGINGLPGMILGLTIPRMYTSFIATKVNVTAVNESVIVPPTTKKPFTQKTFSTVILERAKEWTNSEDENDRAWMNQFVWRAML